jgi:hypothetical protein
MPQVDWPFMGAGPFIGGWQLTCIETLTFKRSPYVAVILLCVCVLTSIPEIMALMITFMPRIRLRRMSIPTETRCPRYQTRPGQHFPKADSGLSASTEKSPSPLGHFDKSLASPNIRSLKALRAADICFKASMSSSESPKSSSESGADFAF